MFFLIIQHSLLQDSRGTLAGILDPGGNTVRQNPNKSIREFYLNNGQLGGGNVQSIDVRGETSEGLLGTVGAKLN
jgi:hypothetical protein